jgi:hypothetical protein
MLPACCMCEASLPPAGAAVEEEAGHTHHADALGGGGLRDGQLALVVHDALL